NARPRRPHPGFPRNLPPAGRIPHGMTEPQTPQWVQDATTEVRIWFCKPAPADMIDPVAEIITRHAEKADGEILRLRSAMFALLSYSQRGSVHEKIIAHALGATPEKLRGRETQPEDEVTA